MSNIPSVSPSNVVTRKIVPHQATHHGAYKILTHATLVKLRKCNTPYIWCNAFMQFQKKKLYSKEIVSKGQRFLAFGSQ